MVENDRTKMFTICFETMSVWNVACVWCCLTLDFDMDFTRIQVYIFCCGNFIWGDSKTGSTGVSGNKKLWTAFVERYTASY